MSEIYNEKVARIMVGYDYGTGDLKAYNLRNTIIMGNTGSGVQNILNNILLHLIQNNSPKEVGIQLFTTDVKNPWLNENRKIPHFVNQSYPKCIAELKIELTRCLRALINHQHEDGMLFGKHNIIIIDVNKEMLDNYRTKQVIKLLARCTKEMPYAHVILVCDETVGKYINVEDCFDLRILTRVSEEMSNRFLGCNLASMEIEKAGFAWVTELSNFYVKQRLEVPYKPESYYGKVCKYLSNSINSYYDAYRVEWERYIEHDKDNNFAALISDAIQWNVTPSDDRDTYYTTIKDYSESDLCDEILGGVDEYAWFTRDCD